MGLLAVYVCLLIVHLNVGKHAHCQRTFLCVDASFGHVITDFDMSKQHV